MVSDTALATLRAVNHTPSPLRAILTLLSQVFAVFAFFMVVTLFAASAARADNERPLQITPGLLLPLPDPIPPAFGYDDGAAGVPRPLRPVVGARCSTSRAMPSGTVVGRTPTAWFCAST